MRNKVSNKSLGLGRGGPEESRQRTWWRSTAFLGYVFISAAALVSAVNLFLMNKWVTDNSSDVNNDAAAAMTTTSQTTSSSMASIGQHHALNAKSASAAGQQHQHSPTPSSFTVAICVVLKDAENYFEEWLDYNFALGFDAIYIYDNTPSFELENWFHNTRNHVTYGRVEVLHWTDDTVYKQSLSYADCVGKFGLSGPKHDYFAFIDVDEFPVIQSPKYNNIKEILADYLVPYGGALTVNWMLVGSSDKSISSPLPITKRFQYREKIAHYVIKSFAKTSDYIEHNGNPHGVHLRKPAEIHTTKSPGHIFKPSSGDKASDHERPSDILLLYHYRYTSEKEYIYKRCVRGEVDVGNKWCDKGKGVRKNTPDHIQSVPGEVFDDKAWQFLTSRVPKYRLYDEFEDFHSPKSNSTQSEVIKT